MNKAKIKGTKWETENVAYLSKWWPKIKRAALEGTGDVGDITLPEGWAVECKDRAPISLPVYLREAEAEAVNKGVRFFVALVKNRRSKGETGRVEDGYAVTRTRAWAQVAFEHEQATELASQLQGLMDEHSSGELHEVEFTVLVKRALRRYKETLESLGD